jgi:hypothetical protein
MPEFIKKFLHVLSVFSTGNAPQGVPWDAFVSQQHQL